MQNLTESLVSPLSAHVKWSNLFFIIFISFIRKLNGVSCIFLFLVSVMFEQENVHVCMNMIVPCTNVKIIMFENDNILCEHDTN